MQVDYLYNLPDEFRTSAIQLYLNALKDIFEPILGNNHRAQEALKSNLDTHKCLVAICDQKLVGILCIGAREGGFLNPNLKTMAKVYGPIGGALRLGGLAMLHHPITPGELYVEGVAVSENMRGQGIGSQLFDRLENIAVKKRIRTISLEVVDTNSKAKALYKRLGFAITKQRKIWPLNLFIKFQFKSTVFMVKNLC